MTCMVVCCMNDETTRLKATPDIAKIYSICLGCRIPSTIKGLEWPILGIPPKKV